MDRVMRISLEDVSSRPQSNEVDMSGGICDFDSRNERLNLTSAGAAVRRHDIGTRMRSAK